MTTRLMLFGVLLAVLGLAGLVYLRTRVVPPTVPRADAHCASGLGTSSLCSEWSGKIVPEKQACVTLEGHWNDAPCPSGVSAAGGTCIVKGAERSGTLHYGSAWKAAVPSGQTRAEEHCAHRQGYFVSPPK